MRKALPITINFVEMVIGQSSDSSNEPGKEWFPTLQRSILAGFNVTHLVDGFMSVFTHNLFQDLTSPLDKPTEKYRASYLQ